ncbi:MAG: hypothetical protein WBB23_08905 [Desulforhopalus sp.]
MNLIRTDQQVALNALYVAIRKSADHYRDAALCLDDSALTVALSEIVVQRKILSENVRKVISSLGDLPAEPDPDRESLEQLAYRIGTLLSSDQPAKILEQRLAAEQEVAELAAAAGELELDDSCTALVDEVKEHVQVVTDRLQALIKEHTG